MKPIRQTPFWLRAGAAIARRLPIGRYRAADWLADRVTSPFLARMARELGGSWFQCDANDVTQRHAYFAGVYEPQESALAQALLSPGATFVDVGANWGYFTLMAAPRVGPRGRVVAIEPDPRMCTVLRANVALNGFSNVTILDVAVAEHRGMVALLAFDPAGDNYGLSRLAPARLQQSGTVAVAARSLDEMFAECGLTGVSLLKMDIEGGEARALAGLKESLEAGVIERILLEVHPQYLEQLGSSAGAVFELLARAGFEGWTLDHSPRANRRAAYARRLTVQDYLRPFRAGEHLDAWPHSLWVLRGRNPL